MGCTHHRRCVRPPGQEASGRGCEATSALGAWILAAMTAEHPETPPAPDRKGPQDGDRLPRGRRYAVRALVVTATLIGIVAVFAVWANRQALNADNWADTSSALLENQAIRTQVANFLVDEVYANVDVSGQVESALPPRLKPLAGPAANGLRDLGQRTTTRILGRPRIQQAWKEANRLTAQQFIAVAEGESKVVTTSGDAVFLDLRPILAQLVLRLGLPNSVVDKVPPTAGKIKVLTSQQVTAVQNGVVALRGLAAVLPPLSIFLFGLAVYLAIGRRRQELVVVGVCLVIVGLVVLVARTLIGDEVVDALATTAAVRPAADAVWSIGTSMLKDIAGAAIVVGIPVIVAGWLAGPMGLAVALRRTAAPWLRDRPELVYGIVGALLLVVIAWGPIPATQKPIPALVTIGLVLLGTEALRRQTAAEFPDARAGAAMAATRERARRVRDAAHHRTQPGETTDGEELPTAPLSTDDRRLDSLERLSALRDAGVLTEEEFAAEKQLVMTQNS